MPALSTATVTSTLSPGVGAGGAAGPNGGVPASVRAPPAVVGVGIVVPPAQ
jgi:hypothetical protein